MAALTASTDKVGKVLSSEFRVVPVAVSTKIYQGGMCVRDAITGDLKNAESLLQGHLRVIGCLEGGAVKGYRNVSTNDADNSAGAAQALSGVVVSGRLTVENGTGIDALSNADIGLDCYAVDTAMVSKHSLNGNRPLAGVFQGLADDNRAIVDFDPDKRFSGRVISIPANASLATKQFTFIKFVDDTGLSEAASATAGTDNIDGILLNAPASGDPAMVLINGVAPLVAGAAGFTAGDSITATAAGAGVTAAASLNGITLTQDTLTDSSAGTANTTIEAMPNPTDAPATADILRDDLVAVLLPTIRNNFADVAAQLAKIKVDVAALNAKLLPTVPAVALETATNAQTKMVSVAPRNTTV